MCLHLHALRGGQAHYRDTPFVLTSGECLRALRSGLSAIDAAGKPFHDPEVDAALFAAIRATWKPAPNRQLIEIDAHINDPAFAEACVQAFRDITRGN